MMASESLEQIVADHFAAYNAKDLERFMAAFRDDVTFESPVGITMQGKAEVRRFYAENRFNLPELRAELLRRIVIKNVVYDRETVYGIAAEPISAFIAYEFEDGCIARVRVISSSQDFPLTEPPATQPRTERM